MASELRITPTQFVNPWDTTNMIPTEGTAIPGDRMTDPDNIFNVTTGLNTTSRDYEPKAFFMFFEVRGGAAGQTAVLIKVQYSNGSVTTHTVTVAANETVIIEGIFRKIFGGRDTTAVRVFPFF